MRPFLIIAAVNVAALLSFDCPALAQAIRTFVSGHGLDTNPCTLASPCRSFAVALGQTSPGGEIAVLDTAGYGAVTINKSVSIIAPDGIEGGVSVIASGGTGITVSTGASDVVNLRGLTLVGIAGTLDGIFFNAVGTLNIQNCVIRGFGGDGIGMLPTGTATFNISDTVISNVAGNAVPIQTSGSGTVSATFTRVQTIGSGAGFLINGANSTGAVNATIADSTVSNNQFGVTVEGGSGEAVTQVMVSNTVVNNNTTGVFEDGANSTTYLAKNAITGNTTAFSVINSGALFSFGDNYIKSNGSDGAAISLVSAK